MIVEDLITTKRASLSLCKSKNQTILVLKMEEHQENEDICNSLTSSKKFIRPLNSVGIEYTGRSLSAF